MPAAPTPSDLAAKSEDWSAVEATLRELAAHEATTQAFVSELLSELDSARQELAERERRLGAEAAALATQRQELEQARLAADAQWNAQDAAEAAELNDELAAARALLAEAESRERRQQEELATRDEQLAALRGERDASAARAAALEREATTGREQTGRVASLTVDLDLVRRELADSRSQVHQLREQLLGAQSASHADVQLRHRLTEVEEERRTLELELESVRQRAAEMAENLVEQKRQMAEDRAQWNTELRQLRRLLERQAELLAERTHVPLAPAASPLPALAPAAAARGGPVDPVIGDVMAQFERLQQDRQKRRAKQAG
jgi:chromosome segregation ATPase